MSQRSRRALPIVVAALMFGAVVTPAFAASEPIPYTSFPTPVSNITSIPYRATGKMLYTLGGVAKFCTATYISSNNVATISTAAHCLREIGPTGAWATNVVFIPGQNGCSTCRPYGTFPLAFGAVAGGYATTTSYDYDVGFFKVATNGSGQTIAAAVGYRDGYSFNYSDRNEQLFAIGMPGGPWGGFQVMNCASAYGGTLDRGPGPDATLVGCDWTEGGASGGPLIKKFSYNFASFTNVQQGVVSAGFTPPNEKLIITYWGQDALNAFNVVQNS